jgi:hypothetical protein
MRRWLSQRMRSADVLAVVATHQLDRPVRHGARVLPPPLPTSDRD